MQLLSLRNGFLALTFTAIASAGGLITGCTNTTSQNQSQALKETATNANDKQMMNHGGGIMNHSMGMDLGPADTNFDLRFIDAMIPHHQGAVEMAKEAQQKSKRPEIKKLADNIIKSQNQEITQMKQWRQAWYPKAGDKPMAYNSQMGHMMEMSSDQMQTMMMNQNLGAADAEFDLRFINAMIPHHEGAVTMGQDALSKSKRPEIKKLAQEIVKAQDIEIKQMQQWRKAWYNK
ncbi:DUF305 domain-containing protein [Nostoc sp. UCD121]|uniref:DUF305 domain-containing protein n=1 Tax=unclassified Nostoc TaxID=2593658 RepID=UPI0016234431|nr:MULTISPECIES: DUF305 domain-containing protein [unclassified Nostoc]MBC1222025.1 DUF305 domain-containing protein [Nostoc sp. UCD120]MBC1275906.1 DUF305 domain-containing protein [Nostoc sp. UCD121]MBC1293616.1 DUF305 domain-containing protein [Nostoc sp. UCD122]